MNNWQRLQLLVLIQMVFFFLELFTGLLLGSLTLVGDSFHVMSDLLSLAIAMIAMKMAEKQADAKYTYGMRRAEVLGALVNGLILIVMCAMLALQAVMRFVNVVPIGNPLLLAAVGFAGLISNVLGVLVFGEHAHGHSHGGGSGAGAGSGSGHGHSHDNGHSHSHGDEEAMFGMMPDAALASEERRLLAAHQHGSYGSAHSSSDNEHAEHFHSQPRGTALQGARRSMNMDGVYLHVLSDMINNIVVIVLGLFVWLAPWEWRFYADPVLCLLMAVLITWSTVPLLKRSAKVLLNATPPSINASEVRADIESLPGIEEIHDLHIWQLNDEMMIATLHASVSSPPDQFPELSRSIHQCFSGHGVTSLTIQPEFVKGDSNLRQCVSYGNLSAGGLASTENTNRSQQSLVDTASSSQEHTRDSSGSTPSASHK